MKGSNEREEDKQGENKHINTRTPEEGRKKEGRREERRKKKGGGRNR